MTISTLTTERLKDIASDVAMQGYASEEEQQAMARELLAVREAQSVPDTMRNKFKADGIAELLKDAREYSPLTATQWETLAKNWHQTFIGLSLSDDTAPPTPAVPDAITADNAPEIFEIAAQVERIGLSGAYGAYASGWNACRAAMLQPVSEPYKLPDVVGMSVSVDVSTSDDNAGYRYFGRVTEVQKSANPKDKGSVVLLVQDDVESNFDDGIAPDGYQMVPIDLINDLRNAAHFEKASYAASFGSHIDTGRWKDEYEQLTATCKAVDELLAAAPTPTRE